MEPKRIMVRQFSGNRIHVDFLEFPSWIPDFEFDVQTPTWLITVVCRLIAGVCRLILFIKLILFLMGKSDLLKKKENDG